MRQGQEFGDNPGNGKPNTAIGKRIFPDLPVPPDQLPADDNREAYRKAKVIVQVWDEPNKTKTVYLRLFDPDDPSAPDTQEELPIDSNDEVIQNPMGETFIRRGNDNRDDGTGIPATGVFEGSNSMDSQVDVELNEEGYGRKEVIVVLSRQPGNNFKVAGAFDKSVRDGLHVKEGTQEDVLRVWTADGKKVPEGNEPDIEPVARATELLTVWRRLHVEVDSMGSEPQGQQFAPDDTLRGDIPDPPLHVLRVAMREAYIEVLYSAHSEPDTWWKYNFNDANERAAYCLTGLQGHPPTRGSRNEEERDYWTVYVLGVYEIGHVTASRGIGDDQDPIPDDEDNDPNLELNLPGVTLSIEPECSLIGYEQIRDVAAQHSVDPNLYYAIVTAHEIGHQFGLRHKGGLEPMNLMWVPYDDASEALAVQTPWRWHPEDISNIRRTEKP